MAISQRIHNGTAIICFTGKFTFETHREFRETYETLLKSSTVKNLDVDLAGVQYIDSSALGMLLLLRESAASQGVSLRLTNPKGTVKEILEVANFYMLFDIAG